MALHDLNQAMGCDRVGVMDRGRLEAAGPPPDILDTERIDRVFEVLAHPVLDSADGETFLRFRLPGTTDEKETR